MKKTEEIRASVADLKTEIETLAALDELSEEQEARFGEAIPEFEAAKAELDASEVRDAKVAEIRSLAISEPKAVESTDPAPGPALVRGNKDPFDLGELRFADQRGVPAELRARAHDALEQAPAYMTDEHRQAVAEKIDAEADGEIARFCLEHGSDEYREAHMQYLRGGTDAVENRTALSTSGANGGYFIPFQLDPTLILTNSGTKNPFRQIARIETIASNVWHGISSAGVTAEWTAEAAEVTDASPDVLAAVSHPDPSRRAHRSVA
jgi:HK97 family phage major capsid protein